MPRVPGDRARLISPIFESTPSEDMCLSFAYSMKGRTVGSLVVYVLIVGDGTMKVNEDESIDERFDWIFFDGCRVSFIA